MIPVDSKFKDGEYNFPSHDINPKDKNGAYCRKHAEAIYSLFCKNQTAWGFTDITRFATNRAYSTGSQSIDQYKSWLLQDSGEESSTTEPSVEAFDSLPISRVGQREGWASILWRNLSPASSILNQLHGTLDKQDFDLYVNTIDADSRGLVEDEKHKRMVEAKFAEWQVDFKKKGGIPVDEQMIYPRTQEEFDMFEAEDGFKLAVAVSMQKLLRHSFEISKWDSVVRKKVVDDLICIGYGAVRDYFDSEDSKWKAKYLDPANLIMQYSNEFDYTDSDFVGYVQMWTISNLRNKLPQRSESDLLQLAKNIQGKYGNPIPANGTWESKYSALDPTTKTYQSINGFKVPVLEAEWMDFNSEKRLYYHNRHGRDLAIDLGYNGEVKPLSEESKKLGATTEVKKLGVRQPYQCSWVIGTDYVFDYGMVKMASRESLNKPALTFHVEQLLQPPIVEVLIPILDEITQLYLRYQNSLAMMVERGYAINTSMIGNVNLGASTLPVADVIKMWQQTGRLLYSYGGNGLYQGGVALPVTPIDGGLGTRVDETIKSLEFAFRKIELFVGINLASLGVTPEANVPTSTTKEAMQATMNALKPILDATLEIKQSAGESIMRRLQIGIRNSELVRSAYRGIISPSEIDALKEMEGSAVQYGLALKAKPDSMLKAQFMKWLDTALQDTRDGNAGLFTPDAMYFTARLEAGEDIMDLMRQMRYQIKKNREESQKQKTADIQQQLDGNAQNEQQKQQNAMQLLQAEAQAKANEEMVRGSVKERNLVLENNYKFLQDMKASSDAEQGITNVKPGGR
jgi:hypothetical protein